MVNKKRKKSVFIILVLSQILILIILGCSPNRKAATNSITPQVHTQLNKTALLKGNKGEHKPINKEVLLATTTSVQESGLLDSLIPIFEEQTGYSVKVIAVGSGEALKLGKEGNADVLLVHTPQAEEAFMKEGFGTQRLFMMVNDFIIVGPKEDPANLKQAKTVSDAMKKIYSVKAFFVSRGDESGTHQKELSLWEEAGIKPNAAEHWYLQSGQGMANTLKITSEKRGYTLTDRASYLFLNHALNLEVVFENKQSLLNFYHLITVNPTLFPLTNQSGGKALAQFLVSEKAQKIINNFGSMEFGEPLFYSELKHIP